MNYLIFSGLTSWYIFFPLIELVKLTSWYNFSNGWRVGISWVGKMVKYSNSWQVGSWRVSSWWVGKLMKSPSTINNTRWQFLHSYLRCQPHGASFRNRLGKIRKAPRRQTGRRSWRCRRWIGRRTPRSSCPGETRRWSSPAWLSARRLFKQSPIEFIIAFKRNILGLQLSGRLISLNQNNYNSRKRGKRASLMSEKKIVSLLDLLLTKPIHYSSTLWGKWARSIVSK